MATSWRLVYDHGQTGIALLIIAGRADSSRSSCSRCHGACTRSASAPTRWRCAAEYSVPPQPPGTARPHSGHPHHPAVLRTAVRRREDRAERGGARREGRPGVPGFGAGRRAAARDLAPCIRCAGAGGRERAPPTALEAARHPGLVNRRMQELLAPELDPEAAPPESVVKIRPTAADRVARAERVHGVSAAGGRGAHPVVDVGASRAHSGATAAEPAGVARVLCAAVLEGGARYSIAATPDGVRIGFGLLTTSNDTLPPGRIHAIGGHAADVCGGRSGGG